MTMHEISDWENIGHIVEDIIKGGFRNRSFTMHTDTGEKKIRIEVL